MALESESTLTAISNDGGGGSRRLKSDEGSTRRARALETWLPFPLWLPRAVLQSYKFWEAQQRAWNLVRKDVRVGGGFFFLCDLGIPLQEGNRIARVFLYIAYTLTGAAPPSSACACCAARCTAPRVVTRGRCRSGSTSANPSRATDDLSITSDVQGSLAAARRITARVWLFGVGVSKLEGESGRSGRTKVRGWRRTGMGHFWSQVWTTDFENHATHLGPVGAEEQR